MGVRLTCGMQPKRYLVKNIGRQTPLGVARLALALLRSLCSKHLSLEFFAQEI